MDNISGIEIFLPLLRCYLHHHHSESFWSHSCKLSVVLVRFFKIWRLGGACSLRCIMLLGIVWFCIFCKDFNCIQSKLYCTQVFYVSETIYSRLKKIAIIFWTFFFRTPSVPLPQILKLPDIRITQPITPLCYYIIPHCQYIILWSMSVFVLWHSAPLLFQWNPSCIILKTLCWFFLLQLFVGVY